MSYSTIKDYTNSRGKTHKAHFSPSGKYLGPVSKKGNEPILLTRVKAKEPISSGCCSTKPICEMTIEESTELSNAIKCCPHLFDEKMVSMLLFKIPQIQDKPAIIEDCDESDVEVDCEVVSESEEEEESESEEEEYEEQEQFTKGRYRGLDGFIYEITGLTAKFAYVTSVKKDGKLREVNQRSDAGSPTGRRKIQGDSIYNNGVKILTTSCKIK